MSDTLKKTLFNIACPACGFHAAVPFYDGGAQPLATLAWPQSSVEARAMERLPLAFKRCVDCGHVFNSEFEYSRIPYSDKPNLMFNRGGIWADHLRLVRDRVLERLPENPIVLEIGCGDGHLLQALAEARPGGRYVGFDPNAYIADGYDQVEARHVLFDAAVHLAEYRPHMLISRHVMEHLENPLGFLQPLAFAASWHGIECHLLLEVPCIDRVFESRRTTDFFYEHNSHFTQESFTRMLERTGAAIETIEPGYDGEVVYGFARIGGKPVQAALAREAIAFHTHAEEARANVRTTLQTLFDAGVRVAVWGGTGKSSAFINQFGLDAERFPLVVDSDPAKVGTFVPGAGQEIRFRDELVAQPVHTIIITTQWRARDIVQEIQRHNIPYSQILLEHDGHLMDYFSGAHPYK